MNLLKKFIRDNNAVEDEDDEFNDLYVDEDLQSDMSASEERPAPAMGAATAPRASEPVSPEKVALKLMQPKSHAEATKIADKLKEGCIVLLDISRLEKRAGAPFGQLPCGRGLCSRRRDDQDQQEHHRGVAVGR